ncbi:MAG TPA: PaaX family transcriptional regulator C-terminal domain-containing protein [Acidimicrobiales bacterium]|nr:PaaX family transcriptional regulator C-terminal domain-containing protein [Acidimicrobiales bacterium]
MSERVSVTGPWQPAEERALTARSVVASTLLGVLPPRLPTRHLAGACALFGISDGTARVAISRMVAAGELEAAAGGYALTGALLDRSNRQDLSAEAATRPWAPGDGWAMAVVVAEGRPPAERAALRRAAEALRLAERREGVWLRPDNLPPGALPDAEAVVAAQCDRYTAVPAGDGATLAASLWDLAGWSARADRLAEALARTGPALETGDRTALPEGFVLSAAVLRHLQADPLLPAALLPSPWPGPALRRAHRAWRRAFESTWATWARAPHGDATPTLPA